MHYDVREVARPQGDGSRLINRPYAPGRPVVMRHVRPLAPVRPRRGVSHGARVGIAAGIATPLTIVGVLLAWQPLWTMVSIACIVIGGIFLKRAIHPRPVTIVQTNIVKVGGLFRR